MKDPETEARHGNVKKREKEEGDHVVMNVKKEVETRTALIVPNHMKELTKSGVLSHIKLIMSPTNSIPK